MSRNIYGIFLIVCFMAGVGIYRIRTGVYYETPGPVLTTVIIVLGLFWVVILVDEFAAHIMKKGKEKTPK